MRRQRIARISITLPADLVHRADQEARRQGRSRSWVVAEALRRAVSPLGGPVQPADGAHEPMVPPYALAAPRLDERRLDQLRRDMTLSPEERLRASDDAVRLGELAHPRTVLKRVIFFDRFEDYLHWKDFGRFPW